MTPQVALIGRSLGISRLGGGQIIGGHLEHESVQGPAMCATRSSAKCQPSIAVRWRPLTKRTIHSRQPATFTFVCVLPVETLSGPFLSVSDGPSCVFSFDLPPLAMYFEPGMSPIYAAPAAPTYAAPMQALLAPAPVFSTWCISCCVGLEVS